MAIKFKVSTLFGGKDNTSKIFKRMGDSAETFGRRSKASFKKASVSATSFGTVMKGILGAQVVGKGFALVQRGAEATAISFLSFDQAITSASSRFSDLNLETKKGQKTLEALKKTARETGAATEFGADQAAQGLDFLALAGFNAKQAIKLLPGVSDLATVANVDLGQATDIASDSLGAFGLMTKDTTQLTKNFTRIQDVLAKTTTTSNTNLEDLFETVKSGAPDFTEAGQSLETFATFAGVMANSGKKGSKAGLVMKNMMVRLAKPSKEAADIMNRLGLKVKDSTGNFRDAIDILGDFREAIKNKGDVDRTAITAAIFGVEIQTGVNILLKEGTKNLKEYRQKLIDSGGSAKKSAEIIRSSLTNRIESLKSALTELSFKFFEDSAGRAKSIITDITTAIKKFDVTPIKNFIKFMGNLVDKTGLIQLMKDGFEGAGPIIELALSGAAFTLKLMAVAIGEIVKGLRFILRIKTPEQIKQDKIDATKDTARNRLVRDIGEKFDILKNLPGLKLLFQTSEEINEGLKRGREAASGKQPLGPAVKAARELRESTFLKPLFDELESLVPPNQAAANNLNIGVGVETTIVAPEGTKSETKVSRKKINQSALGPNNVLNVQGAF